MEADIKPVPDRGESITAMEPLLLSASCLARPALTDLAVELAQKSAGFRRSLPPGMMASLANLVREMNCYYSNLIEGHDIHPIDIERALKNDYSTDQRKRNLQLEAKAHIAVQEWIDSGGLTGSPVAGKNICEIHRRFYENLPPELKLAESPRTGELIVIRPGALRYRDVRVARHIPISPGAVPRFLHRFEEVYSRLGKSETILAAAAAHHRLAWIHPFLDGNGRVIRLMSHAMLSVTLETGGVWSVARGLARNVEVYKSHLAACDLPRRNDLDGRGALSEEALADFTQFFLRTCLDQVSFMESLVQPDRLRTRARLWAEEEMRLGGLPPKSGIILEALFFRGELPRGELAGMLGLGERQSRRVVRALTEKGAVRSQTSRAPIRLNFSARLASRWLPGLFPDKPAEG